MPEITQVQTYDDRQPIERLRRVQLWHVAERYGLPYENGATKDAMLRLFAEAQERGLDLTKPPPAKPAKEAAALTEFATMEIGELRRMAKLKGVKIERTDKRVTLIEKLIAA